MNDLERGYRRLLAWYPRAYRNEYEEEILDVLLSASRPGQSRPDLHNSAALLTTAVRVHVRSVFGPHGSLRSARSMIGLALAGAGLVLWAAVTTLVVPAARAGEEAALAVPLEDSAGIPDDRWLSLWVHDLRWAAIVVVVCGLALMFGRSDGWRRLLPLVSGVVLFLIDGVFTRVDATGWGAAGVACAVASAFVVLTVAALRTGAGPTGPEDRSLLGYAVTAAWCAPLPLANAQSEVQSFLPAGLVVGLGAAPALLVLAAFACTMFSTPRMLRAALPGALALGAVLADAGLLAARSEHAIWVMLLGGPLVAAVFLVDARWQPKHAVLTLTVSTFAYPFLALVSIVAGTAMANLALPLAADSLPADGVAALPGGVLIGGAIGVLAVLLTDRHAGRTGELAGDSRQPLPQSLGA